MNKNKFIKLLNKEVERIDSVKTTKRNERIIEGFTNHPSKRAIINNKQYLIFNSNDYLGLRHNSAIKKQEHDASKKYGAGPGAVRFISGTLKIHKDLEQQVAKFHNREDAIIFSSAFAANLAVMFCLSQGLTKDSLVNSDVLIVSDSLNHRSIIDGVRLTGLPKEQRVIFEHLNPDSLKDILLKNIGKYTRVVVVTDGVFSMLGEFQKLKEIKNVIDDFEDKYALGIMLVIDEAHGVGIAGRTGRGIEEISGTKADLLVGTFGKAFGTDGGYVVGKKEVIDYLRESSATYIYSNSISPGTAGGALGAIKLVDSEKGRKLLLKSEKNTQYFKKKIRDIGYVFSAESYHPIQPVLIGDTVKTKQLVEYMFTEGILVTNISYPVVPKGKDEIRVQISATHTKKDIDTLIEVFKKAKEKLEIK